MLRSLKSLLKYNVVATDGEVGKSSDFVIDNETWSVRYLAVDTELVSDEHLVLLPATALLHPDWPAHLFPVNVTVQQIKSAPVIKKDNAVSREQEEQLAAHYDSEPYWVRGPTEGLPPREPKSGQRPDSSEEAAAVARTHLDGFFVLRASDMFDFAVDSKEGEAGRVNDLVVSDDTWRLHYVAAQVGLWLGEQKILLAIDWLSAVDQDKRKLIFDVGRKEINSSPEYDPEQPVNRKYEEILYDAYGRPRYWEQSVE